MLVMLLVKLLVSASKQMGQGHRRAGSLSLGPICDMPMTT